MRRCGVSILAALLIGALGAVGVPRAQAASATLDPLLASALATAAPTAQLQAVAQLPSAPTAAVVTAIGATGVTAVPFGVLPEVAVQGTPAQLTALANVGVVQSLWLNHSLELALHESVVEIHADQVHAAPYGITGKGVGVAVLDSGIDGTHPDLHFPEHTTQNVKLLGYQKVFTNPVLTVENVQDTDTTAGHGTHVAGIVGGNGTASSGYYTGVAPGANLIGLGAADGTDMLTALAGYDWILQNRVKYGIRVINNSWADDTITYDPNDPLNVASKQAHDAGITVVFAGGNDGTTPPPPSTNPNVYNRYAWPSWVVGVGAEDKLGAWATYSSVGDSTHHPDLVAPGSWIASARALTGVITDANTTPVDFTDPLNPRVMAASNIPYYTVNQGTSMAAPHVAGVVALMLEANPALNPDQIHSMLVASAMPMPSCPVAACGSGGVDALAAVRLALAGVDKPPTASLTATPSIGVAPLTVTLNASASADPDGTIASYKWDFTGSGNFDAVTSTPTITHSYPAGTWHPAVVAVDNAGLSSAPVSVQVVSGNPPTASASVPTRAKSGSATSFDGSGSTPGSAPITSYQWDFGDATRSSSSSPTTSHTYAVVRPTLFAWVLIVTDANGIQASVKGTIKVTP